MFDPVLIRGLTHWRTATLPDGRVLVELTLDIPGQESEVRQILLHRPVAKEVGDDLVELSTALHPAK